MKYLRHFSWIIIVFFIFSTFINACEETFPSILSTVNNGSITLSGQRNNLSNIPDNILYTMNITELWPQKSCDGVSCLEAYSEPSPLTLPFPNDGHDGVLSVYSGNVTYLNSGDYFYSAVIVDSGGEMEVNGTGTVRMYIDGDFFPGGDMNQDGEASQLFIYVDGNVVINNGAKINGLIYATGTVEVNGQVTGAITAHDIRINTSGKVTYDPDAISDAEFGDLCIPEVIPDPDAEYRFDECSWSEIIGEVLDSSGNGRHGTAYSITPTDIAEMCKAGDFSSDSIEDYISIPSDSLDGADDFSIVFFLNTHNTKNQSGAYDAQTLISGARAGETNAFIILLYRTNKTLTLDINNTDYTVSLSDDITTNSWHHVAVVRTGTTLNVYVDGSLNGATSVTDSTLAISSLIVGQEQDSLGGGFAINQDMEGYLDELKIYRTGLTAGMISDLYDYEISGNNWDNSPRECQYCPPVVDYHFDECLWEGVSGEIFDSSNSLNNGTAVNGAAVSENGKLCRSGQFLKTSLQEAEFPSMQALNSSTLTVMAWINLNRIPQSGEYFEVVSKGVFYLDSGYELYVRANDGSSTSNRITWAIDSMSSRVYSTSIPAANSWIHVAGTYNGSTMKLYVNGALNDSLNVTNLNIGNAEPLRIGNVNDSSYINYFDGLIDEVKVFDYEMSASDIQNIYNNENSSTYWDGSEVNCIPCTTVSYIDILHDTSGVVCYPEKVTISIRDTNGQVVTDFEGSITLSTSTGNGTWFSAYTGILNEDPPLGVLSDPGTDDGAAMYAFTAADNGSVILLLRDTHLESLQIQGTDGSATSSGHDSGLLSFLEKGFVIESSSGIPIGTQIAGKPFTVNVSAVGEDPQTGQCSLLDYAGLKTLNATLHYSIPLSGTQPVILNGVSVTEIPVSLQLNFVNGVALFQAVYNDAGLISFSLEDASDSTIGGASNLFVVKPWAYYIYALGNNEATDDTGPVFKKSSEPFQLDISAVCWSSSDDLNGDDLPDSGADLSDNIITVNYTPMDFSVTHSLVQPVSGASGNISGIQPLVNGVSSSPSVKFTEVGIIKFNALSVNYILPGDSISVSGQSDNIGRFIPYELRVNNYIQEAACSGHFTYGEQYFNMAADVQALNMDSAVTVNYQDGFAKLDTSDISITAASPAGILTPGTFSMSFSLGTANLTMQNNRYGWSTVNDPENIAWLLSGSDSDGVQCRDSAGDISIESNFAYFKYGRLRIIDGYGPSDSTLTLSVAAEYYDSSNPNLYTLSSDDSCSMFSDTNITLFNYTENLNAGETTVISVTSVVNGLGTITLSVPGIGNEGSVTLISDMPYFMNFVNGRAVFGIYRGHDKIISWQEIEK